MGARPVCATGGAQIMLKVMGSSRIHSLNRISIDQAGGCRIKQCVCVCMRERETETEKEGEMHSDNVTQYRSALVLLGNGMNTVHSHAEDTLGEGGDSMYVHLKNES